MSGEGNLRWLDTAGQRFALVSGESIRSAASHAVLELGRDRSTRTPLYVRVTALRGSRVLTPGDDEQWIARGVHDACKDLGAALPDASEVGESDDRPHIARLTLIEVRADTDNTNRHRYRLTVDASSTALLHGHLYQETKATLNPNAMRTFLRRALLDHLPTAQPPFRIAVVVGGTSAEACLAMAAQADKGDLDQLPEHGSPTGEPFRALELEHILRTLLDELAGPLTYTQVRAVRAVRHGGSLPVALHIGHPDDARATVELPLRPREEPR